MNHYFARLIVVSLTGTLVCACDRAPSDDSSALDETTASPPSTENVDAVAHLSPSELPEPQGAPLLAPALPTTRLGNYPVAEDLEEEAERTISPENLEAELDRLEAEIGS